MEIFASYFGVPFSSKDVPDDLKNIATSRAKGPEHKMAKKEEKPTEQPKKTHKNTKKSEISPKKHPKGPVYSKNSSGVGGIDRKTDQNLRQERYRESVQH